MSGNYNEFSDVLDDDGRQETGKGLRSLLENVIEENKKLRERLERQDRDRTVSRLFKEKGLDPKVAELMGDADPEEWIANYGSLFQGSGKNLDEEKDAEQQLVDQRDRAQQMQQTDQDHEAEREAFEAMTGLQAPSGPPSNAQLEQLDKIKSFDNEADLLKYMGITPGGM